MTQQSEELRAIIDLIPPEFADPGADYLAVRDMFAPFHGHPTSSDLQVDIRSYGNIRCGDYRLQGGDKSGDKAGDKGGDNGLIAFHCHGGAFVSTALDEYHFYAEIIARQTGCRVVMPDYRLAPEHPWPAAGDDCFHAYLGLLEQEDVQPSNVVLFGESCGGSLAMSTLLRLRDEKLPLPACFISLTGWFDLSVASPVTEGHDPFLTTEWVRNRGRDYLNGEMPLEDPRVSPAYAELTGLPPMYLQVGQFDRVREGAITLGTNALRAGVAATIESWPGMIQGWHGLVTSNVPEATDAWRNIKAYIESVRSSLA